jgi:fibronectin type 3 domain-containing protein
VPAGLVATGGISKVGLTWTAAAGATSYLVKQSATATGTYTVIASGVTATTFMVTGLTNGSTYYCKVATETPYGNSADSAYATGKPVACPTPTGLVAAGGVAQVSLTWAPTDGATSYVVKKATSATGTYTVVASGLTSPSYIVTGLTNGTAAYFKVAAANGSGTSADSTYVTATPRALPTAPAAPKATAGTGLVTVAWSAATGATGYNIYQSTTAGGPYTKVATTTSRSFIVKPLIKGTKYYFVIKAYNANNQEGPSSLEVSATVL